jgi:hypothetical protein
MKELFQLYNVPQRFFISALNGRLCSEKRCKAVGLEKPQPSIFS